MKDNIKEQIVNYLLEKIKEENFTDYTEQELKVYGLWAQVIEDKMKDVD